MRYLPIFIVSLLLFAAWARSPGENENPPPAEPSSEEFAFSPGFLLPLNWLYHGGPLFESQTDVKADVKELIRLVQFVEPNWHRLNIVYEDGSRYGAELMVGHSIKNSGFSELPLPQPRIELLKKLLMENHIRWTLDNQVPLSDTILFYMEESPRATLLDRRNIKGELREILEELGFRFK